MRSVDLQVLKSKLSECVRLAAGGQTILVTDRDRVVAELVPPRDTRSPILADAFFADLVRQGWLTPALEPDSAAPMPRKPVAIWSAIARDLDSDRSDR